MKILQIIQYFSPKKGGSVYSVYNLTKHLMERGHEVTIFTTSEELDEEFAASLHPARVVAFPSHAGLLRYSPEMKETLDKEIKSFDVVHLNNYWSYQNILAAECAIRNDVPFILSPHGSLPIIMRGYIRKYLFNLIFGRKILKRASRIIAVSQMEFEQVLKRGVSPEKIRIIPNAINLSENIFDKRGSFRAKYNIDKYTKIILFLGRIHPIKGVDLLVRAFADLMKIRSDVLLVIAGPDDAYLDKIKKQINGYGIADNILITGPLYDEDKYLAYIDSDIYVLPSRYEIFAITVLEACMCGIPVIITDRHGIAEYIKGKAGEVIPYDWHKLLIAIEMLLSDDDLRSRYGQIGRQMVKDYFTWDRIIDLYEKVYQECLKL
ncbi:MAG: glycosyltransferase [bacterium]